MNNTEFMENYSKLNDIGREAVDWIIQALLTDKINIDDIKTLRETKENDPSYIRVVSDEEEEKLKNSKLGTVHGSGEEGRRLGEYYNKYFAPKEYGKNKWISVPDNKGVWRVITMEQATGALEGIHRGMGSVGNVNNVNINNTISKQQSTVITQPKQRDTSSSQVECPYCHSRNTKKIGAISKQASFVIWGLVGSKMGKQWHCNDCKSDF